MPILKKRFFYFNFIKKPDVRRLFKTWDDILRWYEDKKPYQDIPYWYLERTNIGHLSLAAYKLSGYPLQEFSIKKWKDAEKSAGRSDLYIYIPKSNSGTELEFNIEAKQIWCSLDTKDTKLKDMIRKALKNARKDLKELKEKEWKASHSMALVFILLYKNKNVPHKRKNNKKKLLSEFNKQIKQIGKTVEANFVAIHYADIKMSTKVCRKCKEYWHPGIAVIGKIKDNRRS